MAFVLIGAIDNMAVYLMKRSTVTNKFDYVLGTALDGSNCESNMNTKSDDIEAPVDYLDEFSTRAMASRAASFLTQRMGITMSDGVDRLIFKNQDFVQFFDPKYLFNKGYFGSVEEYKNLMDCTRKSTKITTRDIYKGTRVVVVLQSKQDEAKRAKDFATSSFVEAASKDAKKVKDVNNEHGQAGGRSDYESEFNFDESDYLDAYNLENYELIGGDDPRFEYTGGDGKKEPRSNFINRIRESANQKIKAVQNFGKKSTMVGRVVDICKNNGATYYKIEYKINIKKKIVTNSR